MPGGTYIMNSSKIAQVLEELYPTPSLPPTSPVQQKYFDILTVGWDMMEPIKYSFVPRRLLNEVNYPYWRATRSENIGQPMSQAEVDEVLKAAAPHMRPITAMLKERSAEGPFFMGKTVTFTDAIHAGILLMMRRLGDDIFQSVLEALGDKEVHLKFLEAVKPWTERDDH
jgi:glutathione S-transferase